MPPRDVRPTSERARQAYFNIVGDRVRGARFLDLFAGTGAFAFEAVSRGAAEAVAVDSSRKHIAEIESKATEWSVPVKGVVADALKYQAGGFDLVFADPPYDFDRYDDLIAVIDRIDPSLAAIEHRSKNELAPATFIRRAEYGEVWITFFGRNR